MTTHNFFKPEQGDPDWQFSPEGYFDRDFKFLGSSIVELGNDKEEAIVLRQSPTEKGLYAKRLQIEVKPGAQLNLVVLNDSGNTTQQVVFYEIHLYANASLNFGIFAKNGKLNKHVINVIQDSNSTFNAYGIAANNAGGDTEIVTKIINAEIQSANNQTFLGLAGANSQTVFQSMVVSEPEAIGCEVGIENVNLVTDLGGRCFSKPETYVDSEFSTTAFVSETVTLGPENLYYLQSRGFTEDAARSLLINGFTNQILEFIPNDTIQEEAKILLME